MTRLTALAVLAVGVLLSGCGGTSPKEGAEQAAIEWAEAWTAEDTKRLCQLTVLGIKGRPTAPLLACERYWVSILDERKRIVNGGSGWMLRSPEVTRSRVFDDSAGAQVEVTGASGSVLVFDMSKEGDSWLVKDFGNTWGNTAP